MDSLTQGTRAAHALFDAIAQCLSADDIRWARTDLDAGEPLSALETLVAAASRTPTEVPGPIIADVISWLERIRPETDLQGLVDRMLVQSRAIPVSAAA